MIYPGHPAFHPGNNSCNPGHSAYYPGQSPFNPGNSAFNPGNSAFNPGHYNPGQSPFSTGNSAFNAGHSAFNPGQSAYNPGHCGFNPMNPAFNPGHPALNPGNSAGYIYGQGHPGNTSTSVGPGGDKSTFSVGPKSKRASCTVTELNVKTEDGSEEEYSLPQTQSLMGGRSGKNVPPILSQVIKIYIFFLEIIEKTPM